MKKSKRLAAQLWAANFNFKRFFVLGGKIPVEAIKIKIRAAIETIFIGLERYAHICAIFFCENLFYIIGNLGGTN